MPLARQAAPFRVGAIGLADRKPCQLLFEMVLPAPLIDILMFLKKSLPIGQKIIDLGIFKMTILLKL
mgnify:CR=1 FL=1